MPLAGRGMIIAVTTIVVGLGGTMVAVASKSAGQDHAVTVANGSLPHLEPTQESSVPASALAPDADDAAAGAAAAEQAAGEAALAAASGVDAQRRNDGPFPPATVQYIAYYEEAPGRCVPALGHSAAELAKEVEGSRGMRIAGYEGFRDGVLVEFKAGPKIAVWQNKIDCKDPPYDPDHAPRQ